MENQKIRWIACFFYTATAVNPPAYAQHNIPTKDAPAIIDLSALDHNADPCTNFYQYACGNWIKNFTLPADKSVYYRQFSGLEDQADETLHKILQSFVEHNSYAHSRYADSLGIYFASCMDEKRIATQSLSEWKLLFERIDRTKSRQEMAALLADLHLWGINAFFNFSSGQDVNNSSQVIAYTDQGGMALPDKDYYLKTDLKSREIIQKYTEHIEKVFLLLGEARARAANDARMVLAMEKFLAQYALPIADRQDTSRVNHPMTLQELQALTPVFRWNEYLRGLNLPGLTSLNSREPRFLKGLNKFLQKYSLNELKAYLKWQLINEFATSMDPKFENLHFEFWEKYLNGKKEPEPRWKRCTHAVAAGMTEALGEAYVSTLSAEEIRNRTEVMVKKIKNSFERDLASLEWLDTRTKAAAIAKLGKINDKVGFPNHWRNYDQLTIGASYLENNRQAALFEMKRRLAKIGKPVDRSEWQMAPWEANAYYDSSMNEIVLPIGELLPPIFDLQASDGANFGSLGASTIGHELTHGFDSDGSQFDGDGNFRNWWTQSVRDDFSRRTQCFIQQANNYKILNDLTVNGAATLTENLADQGGVKIAFYALQGNKGKRLESAAHMPFTEEQQFFLAYAQSWCTKRTPESLRLLVSSNTHPPEEFRVNAPLSNRPEFSSAFHCKPNTSMVPANRCSIW